jgi:hypothetical protein
MRQQAPSTERVTASFHEAGVVFFHPPSQRILASNHLGARIWSDLAAGKTVDIIVSEISAEYRIPNATVRQDVLRFVAELHGEGMIDTEPRP